MKGGPRAAFARQRDLQAPCRAGPALAPQGEREKLVRALWPKRGAGAAQPRPNASHSPGLDGDGAAWPVAIGDLGHVQCTATVTRPRFFVPTAVKSRTVGSV